MISTSVSPLEKAKWRIFKEIETSLSRVVRGPEQKMGMLFYGHHFGRRLPIAQGRLIARSHL
jgi:hypothetical protein